MNNVYVEGNCTRDAELKYIPSGTALSKFGIAVNEKFGEKERTHFIDVTAWGKTAEISAEVCRKGARVIIAGRLDYQSWETDSGEKRSKLGVVAERIYAVAWRGAETKVADSSDDVLF